MISEKFHEILDMLIGEKLRCVVNPQHKMYLDRISYAMEFRTIHLDCGRIVGKSEYIKRYATPGDVIIVHDENTKRSFRNKNVFTISEISYTPNITIKLNPQIVYIDEPRLCSKFSSLDNIYEKFSDCDPLYVLLGK